MVEPLYHSFYSDYEEGLLLSLYYGTTIGIGFFFLFTG